jgi:YD repeat-containing protein
MKSKKTVLPGVWAAVLVAAATGFVASAGAQDCVVPGGCSGDLAGGACGLTTTPIETDDPCNGLRNCQEPRILSGPRVSVEALPPTAEDEIPTYRVRIAAEVETPWNMWAREENPNGQFQAQWTESPTRATAICHSNMADRSLVWVDKIMSCAAMIAAREAGGANSAQISYSLVVSSCGPPCNPDEEPGCETHECHEWVERKDVPFLLPDADVEANCPKKADPCGMDGGGGGASNAGSHHYSPTMSGPGATLTYSAGGVGGASPGAVEWSVHLGRFWSHTYARRLLPDRPGHVWLITGGAIYRELWDVNGDGTFEKTSPSDFHRTLRQTPDGFEMTDLSGTVERFDAEGRWLETVDRDGVATRAGYTDGVLTRVGFPDGRAERFAYHLDGKLASITEVGVDGATTRTWRYAWEGPDLVEIRRPDGIAWLFRYDEPSLPGYLTRATLRGTDGTLRVEKAWTYDAFGNVAVTWRGAENPGDPNAVDVYRYRYTDPWNPTETFVTDPLGNLSTFLFERDPDSNKPLPTGSSGSCPSCGSAPGGQQFREDPRNPLLVTRSVDARGMVTRMEYDENGQLTSRTEAHGTALERTTTWKYEGGLLKAREQPSTSGSGVRRTSWTHDSRGRPVEETIEGFENGVPFRYTTLTLYTATGRVLLVDPPGHGTRDQTVFEYDDERGGLVLSARIAPEVGTTTFGHDAFHRQVSVTDPNGVVTETTYDALDRVRTVTQRGATAAADLVTLYIYTPFGDLHRTVLPEGNVIEYGYDHVGRMVSLERKPDATTHGERTFYTLNANGQRVREELQGWTGSTWRTESWTGYVYTVRAALWTRSSTPTVR